MFRCWKHSPVIDGSASEDDGSSAAGDPGRVALLAREHAAGRDLEAPGWAPCVAASVIV